MSTITPPFKLYNVINNIFIYNKLRGQTFGMEIPKNTANNKIETFVEHYLKNIIMDLQQNPNNLNYFNYSLDERDQILDLILNGLEYPGVYEDFLRELVLKNLNAINNERQIKSFFKYSEKEYLVWCINNARRENNSLSL